MRRVRIQSLLFILLFLVTLTGWADPWPTGREVIQLKARPFSLKDVRLLDGPFKDAMERDLQYLLKLEANRLLHFFWKTADLPTTDEPMGGWERTEVRGHTMGHYLSACARMHASTGSQAMKKRVELIVKELARCQVANGDGYLSAFPPSFIDRAAARQHVWAPFYTLHKILAGLIDARVYCDNTQALEVAEKLAGWFAKRFEPLDRKSFQAMLVATEQGGMNEALANLFGLTGDRKWLELAQRFNQDDYIEPLARGEDQLKGKHVNSFIPNIVGTARQFELTGNMTDRHIAEFFWTQVTGTRCYCTGGTSNHEHWRTEPNQLATELGDHTQETCCTYNMLKLTRHLFTWKPDHRYADYYERALWNSILATQDPQSGMMMYFVTLGSGRWKYFNTARDSFWCCTGTGMENHARYGESIYFHDDKGVWVNLFIASEVDWQANGLRIRQETCFPDQPRTSIIVRAAHPVTTEIRIRKPAWAGSDFAVRVNDQAVTGAEEYRGYVVIDRQWQDGDRIDVDLPMHLWASPMADDPHLMAVMYGPFVLAGRLGCSDLTDNVVYTTDNWFKFPTRLLAQAPDIVTSQRDPKTWVKPIDGEPLAFRTVGVGRPQDVTLVPYHRLWGEKYAVYWHVLSEADWRAAEAKRRSDEVRRQTLLRRRVDHVEIGDKESEREHQLAGQNMAFGHHLERTWRHASDGGWFSYQLKVTPNRPMTLRCTYWGSEVGKRTFDILVNGQKLATQTLQQDKPNAFFDVDYKIPPESTDDKQSIIVRLQAHPGHTAGGIFGLSILKAQTPHETAP